MTLPVDPTEYEHLAHQVRTDAILSAATGDPEAAEYQHAFADELTDYAHQLRTT